MRFTALQFAATVGIGGSLLAVAVPSFGRSLAASKLVEPLDALSVITRGALANAAVGAPGQPFPPSVELTPSEVPRGARVKDAPGTWDHLTWRALSFRMDEAHSFAYRFDSSSDAATGAARFWATAHGDLDGDGALSTLQAQGEQRGGQPAQALPGLHVAREVE